MAGPRLRGAPTGGGTLRAAVGRQAVAEAVVSCGWRQFPERECPTRDGPCRGGGPAGPQSSARSSTPWWVSFKADGPSRGWGADRRRQRAVCKAGAVRPAA